MVVAAAYPFTKKDTPKFNKLDVPNNRSTRRSSSRRCSGPATPSPAASTRTGWRPWGTPAAAPPPTGCSPCTATRASRPAIIFAGRPAGEYQGSPVPLLFIHGDKDPVVAYEQGRTSYGADPWPKAFLTIVGGEHGAGTNDPERGHHQAMATLLDFLTWALDGDDTARLRLSGDATLDGVTRFESVGIYTSTSTSTTTSATATTAPATMKPSLEPVAAG